MSGKELPGIPKLPKVSTYSIWLQDSELRWLSAYQGCGAETQISGSGPSI